MIELHTYQADGASATPAVSVILPTFNRAHVLPRAIDSVLSQSFEDFEILVVDDGSTDGTAELMARYVRWNPRVRYLVQPANGGVSAARNRAMMEARGRLFAFLDSDDEWLPEKLAAQVSFFDKAPLDVGLLYGGVRNVGAIPWIFRPQARGWILPLLLEKNVIHATSNVMIRREVFETIGGFHERIPAIEDWDYWIRVAKAFAIDYIGEDQSYYHESPGELNRKSLVTRANLDSREWIYEMYGEDMRRARVAHRFLEESGRRHMVAKEHHSAIPLLLQALRLHPGSLELVYLLSRAVGGWVKAGISNRSGGGSGELTTAIGKEHE
jgi:O-antigen biosynthesis protein